MSGGATVDEALDLTNEHLRTLEGVEIKPGLTTVDLTTNRLREIDPRLLALTGLQTLCLRQNLLPTAAWANSLASAPVLRDLELRDNALTECPKLTAGFSSLARLDLSYNEIRSAAPLSLLAPAAGPVLQELYLANNKIGALLVPAAGGVAEGADEGEEGDKAAAERAAAGENDGAAAALVAPLEGFTSLRVLELGSNRLRRVEGLAGQAGLEELWLGRNRVGPAVGPGLMHLTRLRRLSLQSNRLESMVGLESCVGLEELYLSHNGIRRLEGLGTLTRLRVLDVSSNRLESIGGGGGGGEGRGGGGDGHSGGDGGGALDAQSALEDLWLNDNAIADFSTLRQDLRACLSTLTTVYLDGNPAAKAWKAERRYRRELAALLPALEQLDSDVLPPPAPGGGSQGGASSKREAWVAAEGLAEGAGGARATGPEADAAALRAAAAEAAVRRAARQARAATVAVAGAPPPEGGEAEEDGGAG